MIKININQIQKTHETEEARVEVLQNMIDKLPPIVVADMGDHYIVVDGNHRVEAIKVLNEYFFDLEVTAIIVPNDVYAYADQEYMEMMSLAAAAYKIEGYEEKAEKALEINGRREEMEEIIEYWEVLK